MPKVTRRAATPTARAPSSKSKAKTPSRKPAIAPKVTGWTAKTGGARSTAGASSGSRRRSVGGDGSVSSGRGRRPVGDNDAIGGSRGRRSVGGDGSGASGRRSIGGGGSTRSSWGDSGGGGGGWGVGGGGS